MSGFVNPYRQAGVVEPVEQPVVTLTSLVAVIAGMREQKEFVLDRWVVVRLNPREAHELRADPLFHQFVSWGCPPNTRELDFCRPAADRVLGHVIGAVIVEAAWGSP